MERLVTCWAVQSRGGARTQGFPPPTLGLSALCHIECHGWGAPGAPDVAVCWPAFEEERSRFVLAGQPEGEGRLSVFPILQAVPTPRGAASLVGRGGAKPAEAHRSPAPPFSGPESGGPQRTPLPRHCWPVAGFSHKEREVLMSESLSGRLRMTGWTEEFPDGGQSWAFSTGSGLWPPSRPLLAKGQVHGER